MKKQLGKIVISDKTIKDLDFLSLFERKGIKILDQVVLAEKALIMLIIKWDKLGAVDENNVPLYTLILEKDQFDNVTLTPKKI